MKHALPLLLVLAACATQVPAPAPVENPLPVGLDDTCDAAPYGALIGQPATALERVLLLGQVRIIRPGSVVTQDYRTARINFHIGADETIQRISCG